jgi:hypothetical protein
MTLVAFEKEIANIAIPFNDQALEHIHNDKTILVYGRNFFVLQFPKKASSSLKKFSVKEGFRVRVR